MHPVRVAEEDGMGSPEVHPAQHLRSPHLAFEMLTAADTPEDEWLHRWPQPTAHESLQPVLDSC